MLVLTVFLDCDKLGHKKVLSVSVELLLHETKRTVKHFFIFF
jgi:hypothetical protein